MQCGQRKRLFLCYGWPMVEAGLGGGGTKLRQKATTCFHQSRLALVWSCPGAAEEGTYEGGYMHSATHASIHRSPVRSMYARTICPIELYAQKEFPTPGLREHAENCRHGHRTASHPDARPDESELGRTSRPCFHDRTITLLAQKYRRL